MIAVVALVGCGKKESPATQANAPVMPKAEPKAEVKKPLTKEESAKVIEAAIREAAEKPTGELTKADYERVKNLNLRNTRLTDLKGLETLTQLEVLVLASNKITDVKALENLTQLEILSLANNPDLTKAQIAGLMKALPKCLITNNAKESPSPLPSSTRSSQATHQSR